MVGREVGRRAKSSLAGSLALNDCLFMESHDHAFNKTCRNFGIHEFLGAERQRVHVGHVRGGVIVHPFGVICMGLKSPSCYCLRLASPLP